MKKWTTPMAMEECFTANVDVAVTTCYNIACDTKAATAVDEQIYANDFFKAPHNRFNCGNENHQTIQIDSSNGNKVKKMKAVKGGYLCKLDSNCIFYDPGYQAPIDAEEVDIHKTIYWVTIGEFGNKYHHQGTLNLSAVASKRSMS